MHPWCRRFKLRDCGVIAVAADYLIMDIVHIELVVRQLGMPSGDSRRWIGHQQHAYVGIGRYHRCDVTTLGDDPLDRIGDQLLLAGHQISAPTASSATNACRNGGQLPSP